MVRNRAKNLIYNSPEEKLNVMLELSPFHRVWFPCSFLVSLLSVPPVSYRWLPSFHPLISSIVGSIHVDTQPKQSFHISEMSYERLKNVSFTPYVIWDTQFNPLSASPTKWSNTLKQFAGKSRRIVWVCLTILLGWHLKG